MTQEHDPADAHAGGPAGSRPDSFGEGAAEMANESEVEADLPDTDAPDDLVEGGTPVDATDATTEVDGNGAVDELQAARVALSERTADLQRLQAEYLNYKRRVERDRDLIRENATYAALAPITEVLDTIDRARESASMKDAELDPGFKTVADQLERTVATLGLVKFGEVGDPFDPTIHEALSHLGEDPEISVTTAKVIAKAGYRIGARVVRAAQVLVVDPAAG